MWDLYHSRHKVTLNVWYISCQKWVIARICRCVSIIDATAVDLLVRRLLRAGAHVCTALALKAPVFSPPLRQNVSSSSPPQATPSSAHRTMTTSECIFRLLSLLPVLNSVQIVLVTIAKKSLEESKWSFVYSFDHTNEPRWCHYHGSLPHGNAIGYGLYSTSDPEIGNEMLDFSFANTSTVPSFPWSLVFPSNNLTVGSCVGFFMAARFLLSFLCLGIFEYPYHHVDTQWSFGFTIF